ncbi:ParA family protein [Candidatus Igneacidithiobacillus taiwanensis]|uniref:ParA family protein n=1 Tax=Candidatus Igneacidithiobacillus taiwanensis TaxID=1945924 RepID=UPI002897C432|nr:ParA family protein [Candidatus Igneacidithiobacillus taiwanensis]
MAKFRTDVARLFDSLKIDIPFGYREFDESSEAGITMQSPADETANIAMDNPMVAEPDKDRIIPISALSYTTNASKENASTVHDKAAEENAPKESHSTEQVTATEETNFQKDRWPVLRALAAGHRHIKGENQGPRISLVTVYSPQGGAGVTTIAASLAWSLGKADGIVILAELGGLESGRLFFGLRGEEIPIGDGAATALIGRIQGSAHRAAYLHTTTSSTEISHFLDSLLSPGNAYQGELLLGNIIDRLGSSPSHMILDVPAGRWDLWERTAATADFAIIPLRCDLSALLAVDALLTEMSEAEHVAQRRARPIFVLNQFDSNRPLHQEIAQALKGRLGDMLASFAIPSDEHLEELLASGDPFVESTFKKYAGLLADWLIATSSRRISLS